jgi:hypothetical protein
LIPAAICGGTSPDDEHVGEQQVVHVAAVAGNIDNLGLVMAATTLGVMNVDALIGGSR